MLENHILFPLLERNYSNSYTFILQKLFPSIGRGHHIIKPASRYSCPYVSISPNPIIQRKNTTSLISLLREAPVSTASAGQRTRAPRIIYGAGHLLPPAPPSGLRFARPRRDGLRHAEEQALRPEQLAHRRVEHPLGNGPDRVGKHQLQQIRS